MRNRCSRSLPRSARPLTPMPPAHHRRSNDRSRLGMTLIEVMVALVILGTLLVCAVVARGRYLRQSAIAQLKLNAIAAADSLLAQWWLDPQKVPRAASGEVPGVQKLTWQSQTLDRDDA